jgi:MscS family membrane protein
MISDGVPLMISKWFPASFWHSLIKWSDTYLFIEILLICLVSLLLAFSTRYACYFLSRKKRTPEWARYALQSFAASLHWNLLLLGGFYVTEALLEDSPWKKFLKQVLLVRWIFCILLLDWVLQKIKFEFFSALKRKLQRKNHLDWDAPLVVNKLLTILIHLLALLMILEALGMSLSTLYTFGGIGGVALTLAAKEVIANFFGGIMIAFFRPFSVGDWITSPNKNFEGVVENIGWSKTKICTPNRRPTYVPNSLITDAIIENPGRMYNRQIQSSLHLRYEDLDKLPLLLPKLRTYLKSHPGLDHKLSRYAYLVRYTDFSIEIKLNAFTVDTQEEKFLLLQEEILLYVGRILAEHGAHFSYLAPVGGRG